MSRTWEGTSREPWLTVALRALAGGRSVAAERGGLPYEVAVLPHDGDVTLGPFTLVREADLTRSP